MGERYLEDKTWGFGKLFKTGKAEVWLTPNGKNVGETEFAHINKNEDS